MMKIGCLPLARVTGLEPATSGVTGRRSNQLSYTRSGRAQRLGRTGDGVKRQERPLKQRASHSFRRSARDRIPPYVLSKPIAEPFRDLVPV